MPVRRRVPKARRYVGELSRMQILRLVTGHDFFTGPTFPDEDAMRQAWAAHREAVEAEAERMDAVPWAARFDTDPAA